MFYMGNLHEGSLGRAPLISALGSLLSISGRTISCRELKDLKRSSSYAR